ncbi:DNA-binding MarR family transcriptional regulator/GNAT superfamily N-acetyltransferase [Silvimonas terrae]|uniref:DNA-binding MarR family transcriptional regulator/GNAT superfamily N-acetyltransferase n=1 Tax=Silvimonas terrae TaxID=300266 RepID=A0A840RC33_9NEIS|nr:helix-turn-helix domain-containing GNAT family N-acetyltransferase [Silvimonas terrae]MBB5190124.1 DNA-binding MarR family transcriptional regulator/GNAT superfamily N-acetyltransferase [Silvimonas terrae]
MNMTPSLVEDIRSASRTMVRELGFMKSTLAGTSYSPSAVHALLEIDLHGAMPAAQLVQMLGLEKSSVSRMVGKLIEAGEIEEAPVKDDGRFKQLALTPQGQRTVADIHAHGQQQVITAMSQLDPEQQLLVAQGLGAYANALKQRHAQPGDAAARSIDIHTGYRPGLIGRIAQMHADFYSRQWHFGQFFESKVAAGVAEFTGRLDQPANQIWAAVQNGQIVGSIAIDGQGLGNSEAHLRWFILDNGCRGTGVGRELLTQAIAFCDDHGFGATQLWTFKGLDAARRLYESVGFELTWEEEGTQWGRLVTEQQFTRCKPTV